MEEYSDNSIQKKDSPQGVTGYSNKELDVMKADLSLKQTKYEIVGKYVLGVIDIAKDLIEIQKIHDQAQFQIEIMDKKGELIYADLESFITKEGIKRDTTLGKLQIVREFLRELNLVLRDGDYSDELKTSLIGFYKTALEKVL